MGIDWWEHDPTLSVGQRDLAEENRALRSRVAELEIASHEESDETQTKSSAPKNAKHRS
jgi:hypothetical protein